MTIRAQSGEWHAQKFGIQNICIDNEVGSDVDNTDAVSDGSDDVYTHTEHENETDSL